MQKGKPDVGLEPTTSGLLSQRELEVQRAKPLRQPGSLCNWLTDIDPNNTHDLSKPHARSRPASGR